MRKYLAECFTYEAESGILCWRERPRHHFKTEGAWKTFNTRDSFLPAGSICNGYFAVRVRGRLVYSHRIAWMLHSGKDIPEGMVVDHINGNKQDNRICNLRLATNGQNSCNQRSKPLRSLPKGVHFDKSKEAFVGYVTYNKKQYFAGRYKTAEQAYDAVRMLRSDLHGEYARS